MSNNLTDSNRELSLLLSALMVLSMVAAGAAAFAGGAAAQQGADIVVGSGENADYSSIQTAVDNANDGDTIVVEDGNYEGPVTIDTKNLTLTAAEGASPTVDYAPESHTGQATIEVTANGTSVSGLDVVRVGAEDRTADMTGRFTQGIRVSASDVSVSGNNVTGESFPDRVNKGIMVLDDESGETGETVTNVTIDDNDVTGFYGGVSIGTSYGGTITDVDVSDNTLEGNDVGAYVASTSSDLSPDSVTISENTFANSSTAQVFVSTGEKDGLEAVTGDVTVEKNEYDQAVRTDGLRSVYTAIQPVIEAEGSDTLITVAAGTYNESIQIGGVSNVTIEGAGAGQSVINGISESASAFTIGGDGGSPAPTENISVSGFTINQNQSGSFAIDTTDINSDANLTIEANRIVANDSGVAAYLSGSSVLVADNTFTVEEGAQARELLATPLSPTVEQFTIEGNTFKGYLARPDQTGEGNAIELRGSASTVIDNDFNVTSDGSPIYVTGDDVTIQNNDLDGDYDLSDGRKSGVPAIETATALSNLNITGNQITNYYAGVQLYGAGSQATVTDATIESNTIENAYLGIGQGGDDGTQIVGNNISAQVQGVSGYNVDNMVVEDNTITVDNSTISDTNQADDPFIGNERGVDVTGNNVTITGNDITSINTAVLVQSSAGKDVVITQNNLLGDGYGVDASSYTHTLNATQNWWGTESGPAADAVEGDVRTNPYLTVPQSEAADSPEDFTEFGLTVEMDAGAHAFGVPGPVEGTVGSIFNDFDGTVYAYADGSWTQVNSDRELSALDALVVVPEEGETARASIEIAEGSGNAVPSSKELSEGWNFVGAPQAGAIETAYGASSADPARALNLYDEPTLGSSSTEIDWTKYTFGTDTDGPDVSPIAGYWVYAEEDGSVAANVPAGVTFVEFEELIADENNAP